MATKKITPAIKKKAYAAAEKAEKMSGKAEKSEKKESKFEKAREVKAGLKLIKGSKK